MNCLLSVFFFDSAFIFFSHFVHHYKIIEGLCYLRVSYFRFQSVLFLLMTFINFLFTWFSIYYINDNEYLIIGYLFGPIFSIFFLRIIVRIWIQTSNPTKDKQTAPKFTLCVSQFQPLAIFFHFPSFMSYVFFYQSDIFDRVKIYYINKGIRKNQ